MKVIEIAQSAIGDSADVDPMLACKWVSDRFIELAILVRAVPFREERQLIFPKNITAGLATVVSGTNKVTGDATAQAAWSNALTGRFVRFSGDNGWYQITNAGTDLTLGTTYAGTSVSAGGYTIVPRVVAFDSDIRSIHSIVNNKIGRPVSRMPNTELNKRYPNRTDIGGGPFFYSELGLDAENRHLLEFYPYSADDVLLTYTAFIDPKPLSPEQDVPAFIPAHIIREGVKLSIYEHITGLAFRADDANTLTSKIATIGNLKARQDTIWKKAKIDFVNVSGYKDDSKVTIQSYGRPLHSSRDVMSASEHILAGWSPLV